MGKLNFATAGDGSVGYAAKTHIGIDCAIVSIISERPEDGCDRDLRLNKQIDSESEFGARIPGIALHCLGDAEFAQRF